MVSLTPVSASGHVRPSGEPVLRRLAANLAHNVNNTLTGAIGYLELALREAPPGTGLHEHLQRSLNCSLRVAEMVRRIVAFAFQPAGHSELTVVSLRQLAERFAGSVREPSAPDVTAVVHSEADGLIRANSPLLLLALDQLIGNALEAMPQGGTLSFRVWEEAARCCLSLADTGPGMAPDVKAHLFEPFFTTKHSGHLGLGLALSRDVIEAQGGTITVASSEGQGTTVALSFPRADQAHLDRLPIDERLGLLLPARLGRYPGPHFARSSAGAESLRAGPSYSI